MNKKTYLFKGIFSLSMAFVIASCGDGNEAEKKEEMKDTTLAVIDSSQKTAPEEDISYTLPSPMQIASIFKKSGLKFYSGITNPADNANKYKASSTAVKALNLGVYSADLSYCILNKQNQDSKNYFKASRTLSSEIGLSKAFEANNVAQRMEKNMAREDSISRILGEIQMQTDNLLEENKQNHISVISFTGAWIESMYIGIQVQMKERNANIAEKLVEQMSIAENIIKALKANAAKEPEINALVDQMNSLNDIYNNFKSIKEIKATDPDVIDPSKVSISTEELLNFNKKVEEIRTSFVKG